MFIRCYSSVAKMSFFSWWCLFFLSLKYDTVTTQKNIKRKNMDHFLIFFTFCSILFEFHTVNDIWFKCCSGWCTYFLQGVPGEFLSLNLCNINLCKSLLSCSLSYWFLFILQIKDEVRNALSFINYVYNIFGFTYELKLSTVCFQS